MKSNKNLVDKLVSSALFWGFIIGMVTKSIEPALGIQSNEPFWLMVSAAIGYLFAVFVISFVGAWIRSTHGSE